MCVCVCVCVCVEIKCPLEATGVFIADLIACSTCFGHHYAHHQELKIIIQWLLRVVFCAVPLPPILRTTTTVVCYNGIFVTSHSPCFHGNTPVADVSCVGGHIRRSFRLVQLSPKLEFSPLAPSLLW